MESRLSTSTIRRVIFMAVPSLELERGGGQARVQGRVVQLEIEDEVVVQVLLNVERDLNAVDWLVAGELNLDRNIEASVVVRVDVKIEGDWQQRCGIEVKVHLAQMLQERRDLRRGCWKWL